jgi:dihydrofolate synthase/folylpolyglutamate synthase
VTTIHSFAEANQYLARFYDNARTKYTLDTMRRLMAFLDNPQDNYKVIHVAGTSGKTSTAYYAAALLTAAGYKTGLTVSPHVDEINERVQIDMAALDEAAFCQALTEFLRLVEDSGVAPSWFELVVALAYWYFDKAGVDYAVIEVGLGGLLDGTNVISRPDKICVITDIGLDHVNILGNTLAQIAAQKAGIILPHNHVFMHQQPAEVAAVIQAVADRQAAPLQIIGPQAEQLESELPAFQERNFQLAAQAVEYACQRDGHVPLSAGQLQRARATYIPGRMELVSVAGRQLILDGAHNEQKMAALVSSFQQRYPAVKPAILIALKEGKDYEAVVPLLVPLASRIIVTAFASSQDLPLAAMEPATLAAAFRQAGAADVTVIADTSAAYRSLLDGPERAAIITGSFYLLQQIRNNENLL